MFSLLPGVMTPQEAGFFAQEAIQDACSRVTCTGSAASWGESTLVADGPLWRALDVPARVDSVARQIGRPVRQVYGWLNIYRPGEYIDWHRDATGVLQMLCILRAPAPPDGQLLLRQDGRVVAPGIAGGDALLFAASEIEHRTTPVLDPGDYRVTVAVRFMA